MDALLTPRPRSRVQETSFFLEHSPRSSIASPAISAYLGGSDFFPSPLPSGWYQAPEESSTRRSRWTDGRGIDNFRPVGAWLPAPHRSLDPLDAVRLQRNRRYENLSTRQSLEPLPPAYRPNNTRDSVASVNPQRKKSRRRSRQANPNFPSERPDDDWDTSPAPQLLEHADRHNTEAYLSSALRNAQETQAARETPDRGIPNGRLRGPSHYNDYRKRSDIETTLGAQSLAGMDDSSTRSIPPARHFTDYRDEIVQISSYGIRPQVGRYRDMAIQTSPASSRSNLSDKSLPDLPELSPTDEDNRVLVEKQAAAADEGGMPKGPRFWALMASLMATTILASLEGTIVSTALPTIVGDLKGGADYLWPANAYFLTNAAIAPFYAQMADIFGRRPVMLTAVSLFILGSGLSGGTQSMKMLIEGRTVQGLGAGGLQMMVNLVISDLIPPRQRPQYFAMSVGVTAVASGFGPLFSGLIVTHATWRWVFWLSLPFGGTALILLALFLQTSHEKQSTRAKFKSIDYVGHALFMPSVSAIIIALTYAGSVHPWGSWNTLVPLILGFVGLFAFVGWEASGIPSKPNIPLRVLNNRTSAAVFVITFLHSMLNIWANYFMPVYFQAVQLSSPERSGIQLLPNFLPLLVFAMIGGKVLQMIGRYRELQLGAFGLMVVSFGLFTMLNAESSTAFWVLVQVLQGASAGLAAGTLLPAAQAPLEQKDIAAIVGTFSFVKSFGLSWGVTLPATIFNNKFDDFSIRITDSTARAMFANGGAYGRATAAVVGALNEPIRGEVIGVYTDALKFMWQVATGLCGFAFLLIFLEKHYELRKTVKSAYGMKEGKKVGGASKS